MHLETRNSTLEIEIDIVEGSQKTILQTTNAKRNKTKQLKSN